MSKKEKVSTRDAKWGQRMIEVKVRFWTDGIAEREGHVVPKHAWTGGVVRIERNNAHGIVPDSPIPFNSLLEIPAVIEKVLVRHGITLHLGNKMLKYVTSD